MAATINTNIASINAQRNLALSGQSLNTTMQRLSSGLRVNSAKDDAAGLAIAERMNTQVKGLTVAARNANDGISLAQTAEGALGKVGDMLQRMRELAVQASNATNSASDRAALQAEVSQLAAEIDRVAKQTNFNGQKILDGSFAGAVFQVGANSGDNVTLGALADTRSSQISTIAYGVSKLSGISTDDTTDPTKPAIADFSKSIPAGTLVIDVGNGAFNVPLDEIKPANSSLERLGQVITAINNKTADTGVTAFMTKNPGTQTYDIQFMSERMDGEGKPMAVNFQGFTSSTTGIGYATADYVKPFQHEVEESVATARETGGALAGNDVAAAKHVANSIAAQIKTASIATTDTSLQTAISAYEAAVANPVDVSAINDALDELVAAYKTAHNTTPQPVTPSASAIDDAVATAAAAAIPAGALNGTSNASADITAAITAADAIKDEISGSTLAASLASALGDYATAISSPSDVAAVKNAIQTLVSAYSGVYTTPSTYPTPNDLTAAITAASANAVPSGVLASTDAADAPAARTAANEIAADIKGSSIATTNPKLAEAIAAYDQAIADETANDTPTKVKTALDTLVNAYKAAVDETPVPSPMDMDDADEFMTNQRGIDAIDVTTQAGAWVALKKIDSAIDQINGARATLGAMQARFETAVNNIDVQVENLSAARGRIMDADFAVETANLSRTQILQQAGTAMVAQANQIPQNVLQLLQG